MTDVIGTRPVGPAADLDAKYREETGSFFFTGVQALVRAPLDQMRIDRRAGLRTAAFISGYQGSPLGGYDLELSRHKQLLDDLSIVHVPGLNEELGATAVMGSQLASTFPGQKFDGVVGIWYGKSPGLDRSGDAMRHAAYAGTSRTGGVLALTGDDPACKSSTLPSSSEWALADLHMPILHPGNVQEILDLALHGVALSRTSGLWSALKVVTAVADGSSNIEVGLDRIAPVIPELIWKGAPYVPKVTGRVGPPYTTPIESEIYEARLELARMYGAENNLNRVTHDTPTPWLGIAAPGRNYHEVLEALHVLGLSAADLRQYGIRLFQINMLYPLDPAVLRRFAEGLEEILVIEEKRPFVEMHIRDALYGLANAPRVIGKRDPEGVALVPGSGALDADLLAGPLRRRLSERIDASRLAPLTSPASVLMQRQIDVLPSRTPFFCSGCPHSTGAKAPEHSLVGAGIGCHGMVTFMDPGRFGTITGNTQMGGEGVQWVGVEPFVDTDHFIQNLGDGTFAHSGSLTIRQAVAAKSHMTYKILYNGAVAMTGGQDASGAMPVDRLATWLLCEGVSRVLITTDEVDKYKGVALADGVEVWDRSRIIEGQQMLAKTAGVTVLIHDQQCAAEKRRDRKRGLAADPAMRVIINERVCEGCGDCGVKSNCLSVQPIETEFGRKTAIHQSSCNKDYSCLAGDCPSFITVVPKKRRARTRRPTRAEGGARRRPPIDAADLPVPAPIVPVDDMTIRMPGIGGTGVVTAAQILGTAATLDGKYVGGLDQTGLSQKAGPVVSDLRITTSAIEGTNKVTAGCVDLYLVFDLLVGLAPSNLIAVSPERTVAVVSTAKTPTGAMVGDVHATYPDQDALRADVDSVTRAGVNRYLDAVALTDGLFGESTTANVFQLGVAYQAGAIPIRPEAIEQAIELNGAAVEANRLAFRWGRMWAIDPERVRAASVTATDHLPKPSATLEAAIAAADLGNGELSRLVHLRAADLAVYQNEKYAIRYLDVVVKAKGSGEASFTEAVARYLYKLMAYKDEYEVARLHLEEAARLQIENAIGHDVVVSYNLHPPLLRSMGLKNKLKLGPWITPVLRGLRAGKRLRGTAVDPFGYAKVRRVERSLIKEYIGAITALAPKVTTANARAATELAALPDLVRGYEDIKLNNVERYHYEFARLRSQLGV
jgi:indolepyruvate ferredoxin oxidoreductase